MKKLFIYIFISLFLISFATAINTTYLFPEPPVSESDSETGKHGEFFNLSSALNLSKICKDPLDTSTNFWFYNETAEIDSGSFSGKCYIPSSPIKLQAHIRYTIVNNNGGSNYNLRYKTGVTSKPYTDGNITFLGANACQGCANPEDETPNTGLSYSYINITFQTAGELPEDINISISTINSIPYYSEIVINGTGTYEINLTVDPYDTIYFNVSYANGTIIKNITNSLNMTLNSEELDQVGRYKVVVYAVNSTTSGSFTDYFNITDIFPPTINFKKPNEDNTTLYSGDYIILDFNATDDFDVAFIWINFTHIETTIVAYTSFYNVTGVQKEYSTITVVNNSGFLNGEYLLTSRVCDSHTNNHVSIAKYIEKENNKIYFDFGDDKLTIESFGGCEKQTDYKKLYSKYIFSFDYNCNIPVKKYKLYSNKNLQFQKDSKYKGHFIFGSHYLDFEQHGRVTVDHECEEDKGCYDVVTVHNKNSKIDFNSIGELNCFSKNLKFNINVADEKTTADVLDFTNTLIFYTLFIVIQMFFIFLGLKYQFKWIIILSCIMGILISISFLRNIGMNDLFQNAVLIYIFINIIFLFLTSITSMGDD